VGKMFVFLTTTLEEKVQLPVLERVETLIGFVLNKYNKK